MKGDEMLLSYALDNSTTVTFKKKDTSKKKSISIDKEVDFNGNTENLYKIQA